MWTITDKAIGSSGIPEKIKMDKSGANKAAVDALNETQKQKKKKKSLSGKSNISRILSNKIIEALRESRGQRSGSSRSMPPKGQFLASN